MRCVAHSEREAVGICAHCGKDFCAECLVDVNGNKLCKQCVAALAGRGHHGYDPRFHYKGHGEHERRRTHNKFLLFLCSALPGLNYMYLGMIKRGMFMMSAFFLTIYLVSEASTPFFAFLIPIIFFASFFDGFRVFKQINAGEKPTDTISDITSFAAKHKAVLFGSIGAIVLLDVLSNMGRLIRYGYYGSIGNLWPVVLIAVGIYFFLIRGKGKARREYREERRYEDDRNEKQQ